MKNRMLTWMAVFLAAGSAVSADFVGKPQFTNHGAGWTVAFTVDQATDATADVLNQSGAVIRRLGSGVLGANAPAPFTAGTLSQSFEWDGLDENGLAVSPASNPVLRIRLGLRASFDRFVRKQRVPPLQNYGMMGLAVGPDRSLYMVAATGNRPSAHLAVYSPAGRYVKTLIPFPADFDPTGVADFRVLARENGRMTPMIHHRLTQAQAPGFIGMNYMTMDVSAGGQIAMVSGSNFKEYEIVNTLVMLNCDGTVPRSHLCGPSTGLKGGLHLAFGPSGDSVYFTGGDHAVYKLGTAVSGTRVLFAGEAALAGADDRHLNDPRGIAADSTGNIYVCDFGNKRLQVFRPDASNLATLPLADHPVVVKVHPKTGEIFIVTWSAATTGFTLRKLGGLSGALRAQHYVGSWAGTNSVNLYADRGVTIALDPHGDSTVVYVGSPSEYSPFRLYRLACLDSVFVASQFGDLPMGKVFGQVSIHCADAATDRLYIGEKYNGANLRSFRYDGAADSFATFWPTFYDHKIVRGRDGYFYRPDWASQKIVRRTETGTLVPFSATGDSSAAADTGVIHRYGERDNLFVTRSGDLYELYYHGSRAGDSVKLAVHDRDGTVKRRDLLNKFNGARNVTVDSRGNIFISDNLKPIADPLPPAVAALPFLDQNPAPVTNEGSFRKIMMAGYGSILKFGPAGGGCRLLGAAEQPGPGETEMVAFSSSAGTARYAVAGLLGFFKGISFLPPTKDYRTGLSLCNCYGATYDMDLYDRLVVPDAIAHKIHILDANLNLIHSFGEYDNYDNPGGIAAGSRPALPLELPMQAAVTDRAVYVSSYGTRNHTEYTFAGSKILRARLDYEREFLSGPIASLEGANRTSRNQLQLFCVPNPFNPQTTFFVNVSSGRPLGAVTVAIFDGSGRKVKTLLAERVDDPCLREVVSWNGQDDRGRGVAAGVYLCRLTAQGRTQTLKLMLNR